MSSGARLLGRKKHFRAELVKVKIDGEEVPFEVRQPTIGEANAIDTATFKTDAAGKVYTDRDAQIVGVLIACCFEPVFNEKGEWQKGSTTRSFDETHRDSLLAEVVNGPAMDLFVTARRLMSTTSPEAAEVGKGSAAPSSDASSTG